MSNAGGSTAPAGSAAIAGASSHAAGAGSGGAGGTRAAVMPAVAGMGVTQAGAGGMSAPTFCSGCAQESLDPKDMTIHLHHVHLNVTSRERSQAFYTQFLAAQPVKLNGVSDALHVAPVLLLFNEVPQPADSQLPTALQHVGWGSTDVSGWYEKAHAQGVAPDTRGFTLFNTAETPTLSDAGGGDLLTLLGGTAPKCVPASDRFDYMYVLGPDKERIEIWSGADLRVNHVHFTTADMATTGPWYQHFLGLSDGPGLTYYLFYVDDIVFFFETIGQTSDYKPTDDHVLGHIAFSVTDLSAWMKRAQDQKIEIVSQPAETEGFKSFFVRGPDGMLIELVQAAASKELCPTGPSAGAGGSH